MILEIEDAVEKSMKDSSYLELVPRKQQNSNSDSVFNYVVLMDKKRGSPHKIFSCYVTYTKNMMIVDDLKVDDVAATVLKEEEIFMFLSWFVEQLPKWACLSCKLRATLKTNIPHCTEIFVDHGYKISTTDKFGTDKGFTGHINVNNLSIGNILPF